MSPNLICIIEEILSKYDNYFKHDCNINQIGIGYKIKDDYISNDIAIITYVDNKYNKDYLNRNNIEIVPDKIEGISTDVIEICMHSRGFDDRKYNPIIGGISLGTTIHHSETGTLGIIIKKINSHKKFGITCGHVVANTFINPLVTKGQPLIHPSSEGGGSFPLDIISKLDEWSLLQPQNTDHSITNKYDFATCEIVNENFHIIENEIAEIGTIEGVEDPFLNNIVIKKGRGSNVTIGKIIGIKLRVTVNYQYIDTFKCDFVDQFAVVGYPNPKIPFSFPSDSGSIVATFAKSSNNSRKAIGMVFAGNKLKNGIDITLCSPLGTIKNDFGLLI